MSFENYQGTALDTSEFIDVQPDEPEVEDTEEVVDGTSVTEDEPIGDSTDTPSTYDIEGVGSFTADEIKEFHNGYLRQSDYTKKTQELAKQREELNDALELYDYLKRNPAIVQAMQEAEQNPAGVASRTAPTPDNQLLRDIAYNQKAMETDMKLNQLQQKYGEIDADTQIALFQKATELHTNDLEFVYKALKYNDKNDAVELAKQQLKDEIASNRDSVGTIVSTKQSRSTRSVPQLSAEEKRMAEVFGMSESEYAKWK